MKSFSSIRIYYSGNYIPAGFYDVIGYFGPDIVAGSSGDYEINLNKNKPLIIHNGEYYSLDYSSSSSFSPTAVTQSDWNNSSVKDLRLAGDPMMIYQDRIGDFNGIGYDNPLYANITIANLSNYVAAYRIYNMDVYDSYAIRSFDGTIHDDYHIIDATSDDIVLVETNPDKYLFTPPGGIVDYLDSFTVDCGKAIDEVKSSIGDATICIYEKDTKSVIRRVKGTPNVSGTSFSFNLNSRLSAAGTYFLYLPSGIIKFVNGTTSPFTLIGYKINEIEITDDIQYYVCIPSGGKTLGKVRVQYPNIGNYNIVIDQTKSIEVKRARKVGEDPETGENIYGTEELYTKFAPYKSSTNLSVVDSNTVEFDFKEIIKNTENATIKYSVKIAPETFRLSDTVFSTGTLIQFELYSEQEELPTLGKVVIRFDPSSGSKIFKLNRFRILFCQDEYLEESMLVSPGYENIIIANSSGTVLTVNPNSGYYYTEYKNGYKIFTFEYNLVSEITEKGLYTITIPREAFYIGDSVNELYTCTYYLIELNEEADVNKYCYEMIQIVPTTDNVIDHDEGIDLSYRENNTIFVNGAFMSDILFSPVLSILELTNNETLNVSYYNPYLNPNDSLEMSATLSVLLSSGVWKLETAMYNSLSSSNTSGFLYGLNADGTKRAYKLVNFSLGASLETTGLFFKNYRIGEVPRSMNLVVYIKLNGISVQTFTNIQILSDKIYDEYLENKNWMIEKTIDVYSGEECEHVYTVPYPTEDYDSLVKSSVRDKEGNLKTRYEVALEATTKVRLGNLDGLYNETLGKKQPFGYGLYGQNVFLTGNFFLNNGRSLMDVDDDITMAVGNINSILTNLETLENRLDENSKLLDRRIADAEKGVSSTIANYISTNKDAIFKLGLDYSMWSLGSAGICIYNPNVRYKTSESGDRIVDETTVGDLDESILIQADRLKINNYYSITREETENGTTRDIVYYKILATSVNPKDWEYDGNLLFFPKPKNFTSVDNREIKFYYYYVRQEDLSTYSEVDSTLGCEETLRYAYIAEDPDTDEPYCLSSLEGVEYYTAYAFNTFYKSKSGLKVYKLDENGDPKLVRNFTDLIWFIPFITLAAMFHNGKIYAQYIETEGLEVENVVAIPKEYISFSSGVETRRVIELDYEKNEAFDVHLPIDLGNYPVVKRTTNIFDFDENGKYVTAIEPDLDVPFVIISGRTGKLTSKGADISGTVTIGNKLSQNGKYIAISDNKDYNDAIEYGSSPGMYIILKVGGEDKILSKFSADYESDLISKFEELYDDTSYSSDYSDSLKTFTFSHTVLSGTIYTSIEGRNIGYSDIPGGINGSNYKDYICYPVENNYSNDDTISLIDIPANDEKTRSIKIHVTCNEFSTLTYSSGSSSFKNHVYNNRIKGSLNFYAFFYIHPKSDSSYLNTKFLFTITSKDTFYNGQYYSWDNSQKSKHSIITLPPSQGDWEVYCQVKSTPNYYVKFENGTLEPGDTITGTYYLKNFYVSVDSSALNFASRFAGNGMSSGFDNNNYFGSLFLDDNNNQQKMVHAFKCGGFGMKFGPNKFNYLLPGDFVIPMFIPVVYFDLDPNGYAKIIVPRKDSEVPIVNVTWDTVMSGYLWKMNWRYVDPDDNTNNGLVIFQGMKGKDGVTTTYDTTYPGTSISCPRGNKTIKLNNDAVYEFCLTPLFLKVNQLYGITLGAENIRVSLTRRWSPIIVDNNGNYETNQDGDWNIKYEEILGNTVYLSTPLNSSFAARITGKIEVFIPINSSSSQGGQDVMSAYSYWRSQFDELIEEYKGLTMELQASSQTNSQVGTKFLTAENLLAELKDTTYSLVPSYTSQLSQLYNDISDGINSAKRIITITLWYPDGIPAEGIIGGTYPIVSFTPTDYTGTPTWSVSGDRFLRGLAIPQAGMMIASADPNTSTSPRTETITLTIGSNSKTFNITQLGATNSGGNSGGNDPGGNSGSEPGGNSGGNESGGNDPGGSSSGSEPGDSGGSSQNGNPPSVTAKTVSAGLNDYVPGSGSYYDWNTEETCYMRWYINPGVYTGSDFSSFTITIDGTGYNAWLPNAIIDNGVTYYLATPSNQTSTIQRFGLTYHKW